MPPKQQGGGKKVVIDKTFGMKNKKGGAAQKQVKQLQQQQAQTGMSKEVMMKQKKKDEEAKAKLEAEKRKKLEGEIFAVVQPKVPFGAGECGRCELSRSIAYDLTGLELDLISALQTQRCTPVLFGRRVAAKRGQSASTPTATSPAARRTRRIFIPT